MNNKNVSLCINDKRDVEYLFLKFVQDNYNGKEFYQFEAGEKFFQWFFKTECKLNWFKNNSGYIKNNAHGSKGSKNIFHFSGIEKPESERARNIYRVDPKNLRKRMRELENGET